MSVTVDFAGKTVFVTGGGRGVGKGISERYLAAGADVFFCGRNEPEDSPEVDGRRAKFVAADVREVEQIDAAIAFVREQTGRLDVWINNAGGAPSVDAATVSSRFHEGIIRLNLIAPLHCSQRANAVMQEQAEGGVILNVASVSGMRPSPGTSAYGAAKAGLISLTQSLAVEWAPKVRVVCIAAGMIRTEQSELHYGDEEGIQAVGATVPLGRMGEPDDVGDACLYLTSPMARYVSGTTLLLHGGGEKPAFLDAAKNTKP